MPQAETEKDNKTFVGGQIPDDLYWKFKRAQAARKESATQALEIAIQLYLDIGNSEQNKGE